LPKIDLSHATWHKSTYSSQNGNCVEVARNLPGMVAIRDSKYPDDPTLWVTREAWQTFIEGVRAR
jgi:predicted secreted Zn-dependent protease